MLHLKITSSICKQIRKQVASIVEVFSTKKKKSSLLSILLWNTAVISCQVMRENRRRRWLWLREAAWGDSPRPDWPDSFCRDRKKTTSSRIGVLIGLFKYDSNTDEGRPTTEKECHTNREDDKNENCVLERETKGREWRNETFKTIL